MVLHSEATTQPNTPILPEYLKAHIYLPPAFIQEYPETHECIANIIQNFIQEIGIHATLRWKAAAGNLNWKFTNNNPSTIPSTYPSNQPLIPEPMAPASSHYVFYGCPYGMLGLTLPSGPTCADSALQSVLIPSAPISSPLDMNTMEECEQLKDALTKARQREAEAQDEIQRLRSRVEHLNMSLAALTVELVEAGLRTLPSAPPSRAAALPAVYSQPDSTLAQHASSPVKSPMKRMKDVKPPLNVASSSKIFPVLSPNDIHFCATTPAQSHPELWPKLRPIYC
jgi:hypothetical protein